MLVGTLVHSIFQAVLERSIKSLKAIDSFVQEFLASQETAFILYRNQISREEVTLEIHKYIPNIEQFVNRYIEGKEPFAVSSRFFYSKSFQSNVRIFIKLQEGTFRGKIEEVNDIEENLWVPQLGLKGKVDVKVRVSNRGQGYGGFTTVPLELKTGRATFSLEHKGQLMLYQLMLTTLGQETNSGLLLYLGEGIMKEIYGTRNDQRDLISLRNELAYYLTRNFPVDSGSLQLNEDKCVQPFELPDPISHHSACSKCPYSVICCAFGRTDTKLQYSDTHPWQKVVTSSTSHLKQTDLEYFIRWCGFLSLEDEESKKSNSLRSLWLESPDERKQNGNAITNLKLHKKVDFISSKYVHLFQTDDDVDLRLTMVHTFCYMNNFLIKIRF